MTVPEAAEPRWRRDFPYTSTGEDDVTRRDFARYLIGASGAVAVTTLGIAVWSELDEPDAGAPSPIIALDDLPEGASRLFTFPTSRDPAILLHLGGGELVAHSQKCTHLGCVVYWEAERTRLACPCHEGFFDPRTGEPTAGPPERPLPRIDVEVRDDGMVWALRRTL